MKLKSEEVEEQRVLIQKQQNELIKVTYTLTAPKYNF